MGARLLIVEDEPEVRKVISTYMRRQGFPLPKQAAVTTSSDISPKMPSTSSCWI
jgi:CheY-like chemotaxis protein